LKLVPSLAHQLDEDGNNPLLYVCLKVRGCRHSLVEFLSEIYCDLQTRDSSAERFANSLRLKRNGKLLDMLIDRGTVLIDNDSGEITVTLAHASP
jgi:ankyrin repeat protein